MYREVKGKFVKDLDPEIIAWGREDIKGPNQPLIYIYPQPGDDIKKKKFFAVKDYEKAIFYDKGELVGVLGGGLYELEKKAKIKGTEIVWVDTSLLTIQWGVPQSSGARTKDGILVGIYGDLKLKISDAKIFYNDIVAGREGWTVQDLKEWIMSLLQTSLRDIFKNYKAKEVLLEERERIITRITSKLTEEFLRYGLTLETFNLLGIKPSEGTEKLYEVEREKETITDEMKISELKKKLDEFDVLLSEGKISKEIYETRVNRIEKELKELENRIS